MNNGMKWMILGALALSGIALVAQPPAGGSDRGAFGDSGRGRGGGFVTATYDHEPPVLPADLKSGGVLIYSKTNGFRDDSGVVGSDTALAANRSRTGILLLRDRERRRHEQGTTGKVQTGDLEQ